MNRLRPEARAWRVSFATMPLWHLIATEKSPQERQYQSTVRGRARMAYLERTR